jgi:mRNA interferase MazF
VVARGEIWWVDFGDPVGSEPGYRRPIVIVSSDRFNRSRIATVIVSAVTSNLRLAGAPGNVFLEAAVAGLPKDSVANVSQILTVDRSRLVDRAGILNRATMATLDYGLRLVLDLDGSASPPVRAVHQRS